MEYTIKLEKPAKKLFKEIQLLDKIAFDIDTVPIDWYLENYKRLEWIAVARDNNGEMIGYKIIVGLMDQIFDAIKSGLLAGDHSISHRSYLGIKETNKLYFASTAVNPSYRNKGIARALSKTAIGEVKRMHNSFELISIAVSDGGTKVSELIGLRRIDMVNCRRIMYGKINSRKCIDVSPNNFC